MLICTLLTGCTIGPDYVKPKIDAPQSYRFGEQETTETSNTQWWKQFDDPVLDELIEQVLASNKNAQIAAANVEQAAAVLTQARSAFYPTVGYSGSAARQRASENNAGPLVQRLITNPQNSYELLASASWEIDLWGRIRRLSEAARANLLATEHARRGVILSLVSQTASTYLQLRGLDLQLEIAQQTASAYAATLKLFELQFKYGRVSQLNVEQARSSYETALAEIPQIEIAIAQNEHALSVLLGRNPGPVPRGKSIQALVLPSIPAGVPSELLTRRPDIAQAEQQLIAANAEIGAVRALYFPSISLTGAFGAQSTDLSDLFKGPSRLWSFGGSITGPIFTAGAVSSQVRQTEAVRKAALLNYEALIQSAFADVENALIARRKLGEQQAAQERLVKSLKEYERLATLQYNGGYTPYSTVLQAQQALFPQELNLAQTRYAVYNSLVNIYKATGGGWVELAAKTADNPTPAAAAPQNAPAQTRDRIEVRSDGDASIVDVYRVAGIGAAQVNAPKRGWPSAVIVRLHAFPELESFRATSKDAKLDCALVRPEGKPAQQICRLGDARVNASQRTAEYFEIKLPQTMLTANNGSIEIQWVDQWR